MISFVKFEIINLAHFLKFQNLEKFGEISKNELDKFIPDIVVNKAKESISKRR